MDLVKLTDSDKLRYDEFVSTRNGSFLQSWDWGEWQNQGGKIPHRFFVQADNDIMLAAQVLEHTVPRFGWKYLYIPYGPVFMDLLANDKNDGILRTLLDGLRTQFPEALFIRLEPTYDITYVLPAASYPMKPTKHIQPGKTLVVDLSKNDEELLAAMHPKTRYNIKVAQKNDVQILAIKLQDAGTQDLERCINLIQETAKRQHYRNHSNKYFVDLFNFLKNQSNDDSLQAQIYFAVYQHTPIVTGVMIDFGQTRMYLYGGSGDQYRNMMAPYLMHWQAMTDAKNQGLKYYDLGGSETADAKEQGFTRFKLGFGGQQVDYPPAVDLVSRGALYYIYKSARMLT